MRTVIFTLGVFTTIFFVGTGFSILSLAYAFVSFATTLTEEGDDNNHGFKDTILLGLLTTASVSVNLVIMGLLVSFLKLFCSDLNRVFMIFSGIGGNFTFDYWRIGYQ